MRLDGVAVFDALCWKYMVCGDGYMGDSLAFSCVRVTLGYIILTCSESAGYQIEGPA